VVCVLTGHGLKDPDLAISQISVPTVVDLDLESPFWPSSPCSSTVSERLQRPEKGGCWHWAVGPANVGTSPLRFEALSAGTKRSRVLLAEVIGGRFTRESFLLPNSLTARG
jgi:hypothetical protein